MARVASERSGNRDGGPYPVAMKQVLGSIEARREKSESTKNGLIIGLERRLQQHSNSA